MLNRPVLAIEHEEVFVNESNLVSLVQLHLRFVAEVKTEFVPGLVKPAIPCLRDLAV